MLLTDTSRESQTWTGPRPDFISASWHVQGSAERTRGTGAVRTGRCNPEQSSSTTHRYLTSASSCVITPSSPCTRSPCAAPGEQPRISEPNRGHDLNPEGEHDEPPNLPHSSTLPRLHRWMRKQNRNRYGHHQGPKRMATLWLRHPRHDTDGPATHAPNESQSRFRAQPRPQASTRGRRRG